MTLLAAALLGIVEGITEFLPISSTGHLILAQRLLGIPVTEGLKSFDIAIQLGAIAAVVVISWRLLVTSRATLLRVLAAFIPTAIIGFALHGLVKQYLLGSSLVVEWSTLIGGILIVLFELTRGQRELRTQSIADMTIGQSVAVGFFQSIAIIPGVSRSAATILGGMLIGIERRTIVEFSFLLAIPTLAAATGLDLAKSVSVISAHDLLLIVVGFIASFMTALLAIRWLLHYVKHHTFVWFGLYRIALGIVTLMWLQ